MNSLWKFFTSLRLTVVLLLLGVALVFFGTLAQVNEGLWNAQDRWFRSAFVIRETGDPWWVLPLFPGGYFLGVMLLLNLIAAHIKRFQWSGKKVGIHLTHLGIVLLLVGQLATDMLSQESHLSFREGETKSYSEAHRANELVFSTDASAGQEEVVSIPESKVAAKQEIAHPKLPFTVRVKEYGVNAEIVSHATALDAAGKLTAAFATVDSQLAMADGLVPQAERAQESAGRLEVWRAALNAIGETDVQDVVAAARRVAAQPEREGKLREELKTRFKSEMLERFRKPGGGRTEDPQMVAGMRYAAERIGKGEQVTQDSLKPVGDQGAARSALVIPVAEAKDMDSRNWPYALIELVKGGQGIGTWLVSPWLGTQEVTVDGKPYRLDFRFERYYHPFSVTLLKTTHEIYKGTATAANPQGIPKNFQSRVRIDNPKTSESREVDIYMNNPLRYAGLTYFQYQMGRDESRTVGTSTLQVVRNPSWITPYLGCIIVGVGMSWQFMYHLLRFNKKRNAPEPAPKTSRKTRKERTAATVTP